MKRWGIVVAVVVALLLGAGVYMFIRWSTEDGVRGKLRRGTLALMLREWMKERNETGDRA
jgi:hypothetical protein